MSSLSPGSAWQFDGVVRITYGARPLAHAGDGGSGEAPGDENELRLLLSLRFRIRNDLGLPEDDYDRLLDTHSGG